MLFTLDPHSSFFTAEEFRKLYEDQSSRFFGIGVSIIQHRDSTYVSSVIPGTPADKAGVHYGDRFLAVDGKDAKDWSSSEVSKNVRGEEGTPVKIEFERAGSKNPVELTITRGGVPLPSIRNYFMLNDTTGYVGLVGGFQETTARELDIAIADLQESGMKNLVLDLRNNPGGLLIQAQEVVSRFIARDKTVVSVKGRSEYANERDLKTIGGKMNDFPMVVLIKRRFGFGFRDSFRRTSGLRTSDHRRFRQFWKRSGSESVSDVLRNGFDFDDSTLLYTLRSFTSARLLERFDI